MLPILLTQFSQSGLGLIDTIMAGNVSAGDLAAVAIGTAIWLPLFLFMAGIIIATTPIMGELIGQKRHQDIPLHAQQSLWMSVCIGLIFSGLLVLSPVSFDFFDVPESLREKTALYMNAVALGFPAVAAFTSLRCYSESLHLPRPVMVISLAGVVLDIPLNYVFIYGKFGLPALGGVGCGFATAIIMWVTFISLAVYLALASPYKNIRFYRRFSAPKVAIIKKVLLLGLPIGVSVFFEASLFSIAAIVLAPLGEVAVAAHQVALSVTSQLFMIPLSLAMALTIRISGAYGEKNWAEFRRIKRQGFVLATTFALMSVCMLLSLRHSIVGLYSPNLQVNTLAAQLLLFAALYQVVDAWQVVSAGMLRGIQDTRVPMWITLFSYWFVALSLGVYLSRVADYGAQGFWFGLVVGLSLAALFLVLRLHSQHKKLIQNQPSY